MVATPAARGPSELIACHECDLLQRRVPLREGQAARCGRCGARLYEGKRNSLDRTLALSVTALILFLIANFYPFMSFELEGRTQVCTIFSGVLALHADGMWGLALLVLFVSMVAPFLKIAGLLYALFLLRFERNRAHMVVSFRLIQVLRPWGMLEIFLLAGLVALVKLGDLATIVPGTAFWAFSGLIVVAAAAGASLDPGIVWRNLESSR